MNGKEELLDGPPRNKKSKTKNTQMLSSQANGSSDEDDVNFEQDKEQKESNTIMQQINNFSLTPMNDSLAEQTIEDHKYLLELVENKCAIAFYAVINRNQSLYNALQQFTKDHAATAEEAAEQ